MTRAELELLWRQVSSSFKSSLCDELLTPWGHHLCCSDYAYAVSVLVTAERVMARTGTDIHFLESVSDLMNFFPRAYADFFASPHPFCLCSRWGEISESTRAEVLVSSEWVATEKVRGLRARLYWYADSAPYLLGRGYAADGGILDWSDLINGLCYGKDRPSHSLVLDVELCLNGTVAEVDALYSCSSFCHVPEDVVRWLVSVGAEDALRVCDAFLAHYGRPLFKLVLLYPLRVNSVDCLGMTQRESWAWYDSVVECFKGTGISMVPLRRVSGGREVKARFLDYILQDGGEGVVFHNGSSFYNTAGGRSSGTWIKVKRSLFDLGGTPPVDDTFDVVITGCHDFGSLKQLSLGVDVRDANGMLTPTFLGTVLLRSLKLSPSEYVGRVVEVACDGFTDSLLMIRPRLVRLRDEKVAHETGYRDSYLRGFIR